MFYSQHQLSSGVPGNEVSDRVVKVQLPDGSDSDLLVINDRLIGCHCVTLS